MTTAGTEQVNWDQAVSLENSSLENHIISPGAVQVTGSGDTAPEGPEAGSFSANVISARVEWHHSEGSFLPSQWYNWTQPQVRCYFLCSQCLSLISSLGYQCSCCPPAWHPGSSAGRVTQKAQESQAEGPVSLPTWALPPGPPSTEHRTVTSSSPD